MRLVEVEPNHTVRVISFDGEMLKTKLTQFGVYPGDSLRILRRAPFKGPILVEVGGREVALGRGVAAKIIVEEVA